MKRLNASLLGSFAAAATLASAPAHAQDRTARVDSIFSFITPDAPGCAVGVSQRGKMLVSRAYGLADLERRASLSAASVFDIGSVQKQFVAAAVLLLVEDGRLSLSENVRTYLPELPDYGQTITLNHLLTHTSGIRDWPGLLSMSDDGVDVLTLIMRQRGTNFAPGDELSYSNSGYVLLKEIVARASGMSFAEFAEQRLFEPLGMTSSAYVADIMQADGERALAYEKEDSGWTPHMRLGNDRGGGAVVSNVGDLLIWNDALTNSRLGAFVTAKLQEPATLNNGRRLSYARGLTVNDVPGGPLVSHSGGAAGYSAWLGRFMGHDVSVAVLCNFEPVSATALAGRVADLFLPPVDPDTKPAGPVAVPGVDVAGRAGVYFDETTGEVLRLIVRGDRLAIAAGPPLVAVSAERFRPPRASMSYRSEDAFELIFRSNDEFDLKSMEGQSTRYRRAQPWNPSAAELQTLDGRYGNEEIGTVFEVVAGTDGLVFRFEQSPDRALEMKAVARDTYMREQGVAMVRFVRDAAGKVTGMDYSTPVLSNLRLTRLGERSDSSPPVAAAGGATGGDGAAGDVAAGEAAAGGDVAAPQLDGLVGEYELAPGRSVRITLEGGQLYGEPTGNPKRRLVHASGTTFDVAEAEVPVTVTFTVAADGHATALVMRRNGSERTLQRVR